MVIAPNSEHLRTELIARIDNLRGLDENQKGVNRPF